MKIPHDFERAAIRREFKKPTHDAPDPSLHQEIIYDESGIKIGATTRLELLVNGVFGHDPRNHIGENF